MPLCMCAVVHCTHACRALHALCVRPRAALASHVLRSAVPQGPPQESVAEHHRRAPCAMSMAGPHMHAEHCRQCALDLVVDSSHAQTFMSTQLRQQP